MEQFDQLLTCAICLDRYRNPKLLPCQHSFCMEPCMEGLINYVTRQVKCPECRAEHRIPYQGIQQYPTNVTLQRFLELHIEITGELPDPTSGQVMERCGVCSEKSYCSPCSHCDKRVCSDCKEAHLDILRREIARVNGQVRRTLPRLQDALGVIDKNSAQLQQNCSNIIEEVEGIYARLSKALKDRTDSIKSEIEVFLAKELRSLSGLQANLEHEISNFDSNSDFAEKHINSENCSVAWDDNELMDTKDIFLRTMEFIRNFESEPGEYHRRVRFFVPQDINQLSNTMSNLGELNINPSQATSSSAMYPLSQGAPSAPSLGPGLMRSKSDHRVAAQFRQAEERYQSYGSDNNDDSFSTSRPRYFGDRHNTSRPAVESSRYGESTTSSSRRGDYDYDDNVSTTETGRRSRFRSRFMRHHDSGDSDNEPSNRSVRFQSSDCSSDAQGVATKKVERQRVLDTEDAARGPLSGITRLSDSPRVLKRIQEVELKGRRRKPTPPTTLSLNVTSATGQLTSPSQPRLPTGSGRVTGRQVSEEDEIAKIKKQNKSQEAAIATSSGSASAEVTSASHRKSDSSVPSTPTSAGERPRFASSNSNDSKPAASRQTSTTSETTTRNRAENDSSSSTATPTGEEDGRVRKRSSYQSGNGAASKSGDVSLPESGSSGSRPTSFASNTSSPGDESSERAGRRVGRVSVDRFNKSASSESSTSAESSTHSSPVRNTGAAFSTGEIKSRFIGRKSSTGSNGETGSSIAAGSSSAAAMATTTTRSRFGNISAGGTPSTTTSSGGRYGSSTSVSSPATTTTANSSSSNGTNGTHRFSRFLNRAGTPTAEASKGSENSQSSDDDSSDSSETDSAADQQPPRKSVTATASTVTATTGKDREALARTDIGPLLARSAQARDTTTSYPSNSSTTNRPQQQEPSSSSSYSTRVRTNPSSLTGSNTARSYGTSRYGPDSTGAASSSSSISRSRTGSSLAEDLENKYPLTSKYLNRSRASMASDPSDTTNYTGSSTGSRKFSSRFLNKSESFAALNLAEKKDAMSDEGDDDEDENYLQPIQVTADDRRAQKERSSLSSSTRRLVGNKSPSPTLSSTQKPQLAFSGEDRYPSGRSRYAALKDRRSRLARSRSSHEVVAHQQQGLSAPQNFGPGVEVEDTRTSTHEPTSPTTEGSESSLSTWARYLKNKYGPRNKKGEDGKHLDSISIDSSKVAGNIKPQRFSRSRSIGSSNLSNNSNNNNERWGSSDNIGNNNKESNLITSQHHNYTQKRKVLMKLGTRGSEPGSFTWPRGVAIGPDNSIVVADSSNHRVQIFDNSGAFLKQFGYYGNNEGEFDCLAGVAINRIGQYIIADRYNHRIQVFDPSFRFLRAFGSQGTTDGKFSYPWGVTTDALGFIYVCDKENHRVQVFQSDGTFVGKFGSLGSRPGQLEHPHYIAVSSTNRVIVSDSNNHRVQVFDVNGKLLNSFGSEGAEEGQFKFPRGVAVDDQGFIIVADSGNNRIQIFTADGGFVTSFGCWGSGDGEFKGLEGIAVLSNGNIVVCDRENHRIIIMS